MNIELFPDVLQKIINDINAAKSGYDASLVLTSAVEKGIIEMKNGVLFRKDEYVIQNLFSSYGRQYEENIRLLNTFGLSIIPVHLGTIEKDNDMFIFTKINGCKTGDLKHFYDVKSDISEENKQLALENLTKLTQEGYTDDKIFSSPDLWYVSPDENKIVLPSFEALRKVNPGEEEAIINSYKRILFEI